MTSELITTHRGATITYTEDVGESGRLYAWILLPGADPDHKICLCERLLRIVTNTRPDPTDLRRSFQAAIVARIDLELDHDYDSWVGLMVSVVADRKERDLAEDQENTHGEPVESSGSI